MTENTLYNRCMCNVHTCVCSCHAYRGVTIIHKLVRSAASPSLIKIRMTLCTPLSPLSQMCVIITFLSLSPFITHIFSVSFSGSLKLKLVIVPFFLCSTVFLSCWPWADLTVHHYIILKKRSKCSPQSLSNNKQLLVISSVLLLNPTLTWATDYGIRIKNKK